MDTVMSDDDFTSRITQLGDATVLVYFNAAWSGPGRMTRANADAAATQRGISAFEVDIDECPKTAQAYGIRTAPSVVVLKNGTRSTSSSGPKATDDYVKLIGD